MAVVSPKSELGSLPTADREVFVTKPAYVQAAAEGAISAEPVGSPARDLQARLEAEIGTVRKMSARSVTALVIVVCLSTWLTGFWLYASL
jgi:hypothetical protein